LNYLNESPEGALFISIKDNDMEVFKYLLVDCSTINCEYDGYSPLMYAYDRNNTEMFNMLVEHNERLTYIFKNTGMLRPKSLFTLAMERDDKELMRLILGSHQTAEDPQFIEHIRNSARGNTNLMILVSQYFP
jgi:hypothetical protein